MSACCTAVSVADTTFFLQGDRHMKLSHKPVRYCLTEYRGEERCAFLTALTHFFFPVSREQYYISHKATKEKCKIKYFLCFSPLAFRIMLPLFEILFDSVEFWLFCSKYNLTCVIFSPACEGENG